MKKSILNFALLGSGILLLSGCVSIPPLIQVEHKDAPPPQNVQASQDLQRRLDAIDKRLDRLEEKLDKKTP